MKKRIIALALAFVMVLGTVAVAAGGSKTISVTPMGMSINGQTVTPTKSDGTPAEVFAYDGATYVPLRYLSELLGITVEWDKNDPATAKLVSDKITLPAGGGLKDGVYTGEAQGFGGAVTVTVTVSGGKVTDGSVTGDKESAPVPGFLDKLTEQVKTGAIDGVSGATITSGAAKDALAAALSQAGGAGAATAKMKPGTYTADAVGRNGYLTVAVTVSADAIQSVEVLNHYETVGVADSALENIPRDMVAQQSLSVDTYTGATITCNAIMAAAQKALADSGADLTGWKKFTSRHDITNERKELSADVVVVGAGAAGMAAAVSAAESGAKSVLVVETLSTIGGNAMVSGGFLEYMGAPESIQASHNAGRDQAVKDLLAMDVSGNALMTEWQTAVRKQYEDYKKSGSTYIFDSNELLAMQYHVLNLGRPDDSLIGYAQKSHAVCDWFTGMGVEWGPCQDIIGFPWPRWSMVKDAPGGSGFFAALTQNIKKNNLPVEILLETTANELITEGDKVVGVVAKNIDGTTYRITTKKGVILATGGFGSNGEMLERYNTQWAGLTADVNTDNRTGTTGLGITMAQSVNGGTAIMDQYMMFPLANPKDGALSHGINGNLGLYINKEGKRFVDETLDRNTISQAILNQTDSLCYIIADAENSGIGADGSAEGISLDFLLDTGAIFKADTLEELAQKIGVDPAALTTTVKSFNQAAATFTDPELGRVAFLEDSQIDKAPFYACPRTPTVHIILGGLTCAPTGEVISTAGAPIPGLYAAGEVTAGGAALSSFADGMALGQYLFGK